MHFFFFNDTATTEIYSLSLHDALPILGAPGLQVVELGGNADVAPLADENEYVGTRAQGDRKSTRLNSSHSHLSYAVVCLKKNTSVTSTFPSVAWMRATSSPVCATPTLV